MTCCVTGARPENFPFVYIDVIKHAIYLDELRDKIENLIYEGYTHFISGMARGVDLDFALLVNMLKFDYFV